MVDRIQMSAAAAALVREQAPELANRIHSRAGVVTPKGKSPMQTFWLFTDTDMEQIQTRGSRTLKRRSETLTTVDENEVAQLGRPRARSMDGTRPDTGVGSELV